MKAFRIFLYFLFLTSLCCCVPPEITLYGDISGTVTDGETGDPIPDAKLKLNQPNDSTFSGVNGSYKLNNIETGNYQVQASKPSYEKATKNATVDQAETTEIDFALSKLPWPEISPKYLDFEYEAISGYFTIKNIGAGKLKYSFPATPEWVTLSPSSGEATVEEDTITVTIDRAAIKDETYKERIRILSLSGEQDVWDTVNVYVNGLLDDDDNYYKVVTIGTQTWMAENLNTGKKTDFNGLFVLSDNGIVEKYCYNNSEANCNIYGGLYSWDEMMDYVSDDEGIYNENAAIDFHAVQGICPDGWHIPDWVEWEILKNFVGGAVAGAKLKAVSPLWEGDTIKTDDFGFAVLPGGGLFSFPGVFDELRTNGKGEHAVIWKATQNLTFTNGYFFWLMENFPAIQPYDMNKLYAASVRCIKDPE